MEVPVLPPVLLPQVGANTSYLQGSVYLPRDSLDTKEKPLKLRLSRKSVFTVFKAHTHAHPGTHAKHSKMKQNRKTMTFKRK